MTSAAENPTKLLLHACCGPCSMEPVRLLRERGVEPHVYYANSNIHPPAEYARRLETIRGWAASVGLSLTEGRYDVAAWEATAGRIGDAARARFGVIAGDVADAAGGGAAEAAAGTAAAGATAAASAEPAGATRGGAAGDGTPTHSAQAESARQARCRACYRLRFEEAARFAAENGFDALGTTLSVSPYQYTDVIREELGRAARAAGVRPLFEDYRPCYAEATRRSREAGLYRQNFCGCRFSEEEAAVERAARKRFRAEAREREAAAHA
ncbi:epoxyqueuosine reductase QueH, partial [Adlercreutzia sp. ZJ242]|uniref:epoxyqueuosine reductase QueH n=1 Tax=Adlercreutzia sp. ZJ242 TaxID=2709409 RepID=UPI002108400D